MYSSQHDVVSTSNTSCANIRTKDSKVGQRVETSHYMRLSCYNLLLISGKIHKILEMKVKVLILILLDHGSSEKCKKVNLPIQNIPKSRFAEKLQLFRQQSQISQAADWLNSLIKNNQMWQKLLCHRYIADRLKDLWNLSQIGANLKTQWHFKILIEKYKTGLVDIVYFEKNLCCKQCIYEEAWVVYQSQKQRLVRKDFQQL